MNRAAAIGTCAWPGHLRPGALRWARSSAHYAATVAFYRDAVGLPVVGEFTASFGEDGTIFGLPTPASRWRSSVCIRRALARTGSTSTCST